MSVPTFAVFAASSIRASGQLNWPVAAYLSGAVLVGGWLAEQLNHPRPLWRRLVRWAVGFAVGLGFALCVLAHDTRMFTRLAVPIATTVTGRDLTLETDINPVPIRAFDPAARLKGYRYLGSEIDRIRQAIREAGDGDPVLVGHRWDMPGLVGFYTEGHPQAYSIGLVLRLDRHSQYDLWRPNPTDDAQEFLGRTFVVVAGGNATAALTPAFVSVSAPQEVVYREDGRAVAKWYLFICRGFKGFDPTLRPGNEAGH